MLAPFRYMLGWILSLFRSRTDLVLENLALRQQLLAVHAKRPRPRLGAFDKLFWVLLRRVWSGMEEIVDPCHPGGHCSLASGRVRQYWRWISCTHEAVGRKLISREVRDLIFRMVAENPMPQLGQRSALSVPPMASQSANIGGDRNQDRPLRSPVPSVRGKVNRHHSTRVFGSHVVLDDCRSRKQTARFQNLLQQPSHAYLTGKANAGYARATTNRKSPLISLATSSPILISDTTGGLTFQRLGLTAVSGQPLQKPGMKSSSVCVLGCSAFRGSDRFTATVSIRQMRENSWMAELGTATLASATAPNRQRIKHQKKTE
jgi:hypothetical protein